MALDPLEIHSVPSLWEGISQRMHCRGHSTEAGIGHHSFQHNPSAHLLGQPIPSPPPPGQGICMDPREPGPAFSLLREAAAHPTPTPPFPPPAKAAPSGTLMGKCGSGGGTWGMCCSPPTTTCPSRLCAPQVPCLCRCHTVRYGTVLRRGPWLNAWLPGILSRRPCALHGKCIFLQLLSPPCPSWHWGQASRSSCLGSPAF